MYLFFLSYLRGHSANGVNVIASADEVWCVELQLKFAQPFNNGLWSLGEKTWGSVSLSQFHSPPEMIRLHAGVAESDCSAQSLVSVGLSEPAAGASVQAQVHGPI